MKASSRGREAVCRLLVELGAEMEAKDNVSDQRDRKVYVYVCICFCFIR